MNVYVYQISDTEYDAGFIRQVCAHRGRIVETWPVDTPEQRAFLESHGSAYGDVSEKVVQLARKASSINRIEDVEQEIVNGAMLDLVGLSFTKRLKVAIRLVFGRNICN